MSTPRDELTELYSKLTKSQLEFVHNFIAQDFKNATLAYCNAYPDSSAEAARRSASLLLTKPDIKRCIALEIEAILAESKIPLEKKIFETYVSRAFYDIADILNDDGSLRFTMSELKAKGLSICIDGVDVKVDKDGGEHVTYHLADKEKSLDMLQRYIQMIKQPDAKVAGTDKDGNAFSFVVSFLKPEDSVDAAPKE